MNEHLEILINSVAYFYMMELSFSKSWSNGDQLTRPATYELLEGSDTDTETGKG